MPSPKPLDATLYASVKEEAKRKFRRWPSAYGSAWLSKTYRARGGRYSKKKGSPTTKRSSSKGGVNRWMKEEWVQVEPATRASHPQFIACGDARRDGKACRPRYRLSPHTPLTVDEVVRKHGRKHVRSLAKKKSRHMSGRVDWNKGTFTHK